MRYLVLLLTLFVSACASEGMKPNGDYPKMNFDVKIGYQEAYRRADKQLRECKPEMRAIISGNLYTDKDYAEVFLISPESRYPIVRIEIKGIDKEDANISSAVIGNGIFDENMLKAIKRSIVTGNIICSRRNIFENNTDL